MAVKDPYAATAIQAAPRGATGDPYAATAVATTPAPDFTSNPQGEGLYDMQGPSGVTKVPFSKVRDAAAQGYTLAPATAARYRDDFRATQPSWFQRVTEPSTPTLLPTKPVDSGWDANRDAAWNAAANAMHILGTGSGNVVKRAARTVAGAAQLPFHVADIATRLYSSDPETSSRAEGELLALHPGAQLADRGVEAKQDWQKSPALAGENIAGDALAMWAMEKVPGVVKETGAKLATVPESLARGLTDTGAAPIKRLVKETQAANEKIDAVNADRIEAQRKAQEKADYDHRANLLKLKQKLEQDMRDATEKARTGTDADRAQYQSKQLAAKQKYEQAVRDATERFSTTRAEVQRTNAEAQQEYNRKIGQTAQHNRAVTEAERAKADQAGRLQVGGSQLMYGLRQLDQALRERANQMYDAVRTRMAGAALPSDTLADAVRAAQEKWIRGSPEKVREFNAMLSQGERSPELTLADQTAQNLGYKDFRAAIANSQMRDTLSRALPPDVWQAAVGQGTKPILWNDLQGFYEETGARISDGPQPGKADIYKALQQVHGFIGDQMQRLADAQGAGKLHADARAFYRDYMQTFHEPTGPSGSGSPVAQALLAKDPLVAVDKFAGDAGERGVAILRRYSDSLANLAQDVQQTARAKVSAPSGGRKAVTNIPKPSVKPVPAGANLPLPPVLESAPAPRAPNLPLPPVLPEPETVPVELKPRQTISTPDLVAARKAAAEARAGKVQTRGTWVSTWPIFQAMRALWGGHIPSIPTMALEAAGTYATTRAAAALMEHPPMIRFLTQARPEDIALIPPDLRGELPGLVSLAKRQGIKVAPALSAVAGAMGSQTFRNAQPSLPPAAPVAVTPQGEVQ